LETPFDGLKPSNGRERLPPLQTKKANVAEHPQVFRHVGLLTNKPLGTAGVLSN